MSDEQKKREPKGKVPGIPPGFMPPGRGNMRMPQLDGTTKKYNPSRDFAYVAPDLVGRALHVMQSHPQWRERLAKKEISPEALGQAAQKVAKFWQLCVGPDKAQTLEEGIEQSGLLGCVDDPVQRMIFECFGWMMIGSAWLAVRDITERGQQSPVDLDTVIDAGEAAYRVFMGIEAAKEEREE